MRLSPSDRESTRGDRSNDGNGTRSSVAGIVRKMLLAGTVFLLAYVVTRWLQSGDEGFSTDELEGADLDDGRRIPIGGMADEYADENEASDEGSEGDVTDEGGEIEGADEAPEADDMPGDVERSDEEIEERAESNVQEEPAEPGEMTVDEEVAEDIVDEEFAEGEEEEMEENENNEE